ncbi:amidohydrolase [Enemella evansiae]|nr:amidohydrolase [Enemella evansiae]
MPDAHRRGAVSRIVDTHLHVWDTGLRDHPWLATAELPAVTGLPDEADRSYVLVEADAADAWDEAQWLDRVAADPRVHGIVASLDLDGARTDTELRRLRGLASLVGVRLLLQDSGRFDDPDLLLGLRVVADHGLPFDACVRAGELPQLRALLAQVPELTVVLDHLGKPPLGDPAGLERWRADLGALAELPQVHCKLSGLPAEAADEDQLRRMRGPVVAHALAMFGAGRCLIGSDRPVSRTAEDWCAWALSQVDAEDRPRVGEQNAMTIYRRAA